jgi:endonuclease/exonuclease/phosphatase family metal-dependent hydrolase
MGKQLANQLQTIGMIAVLSAVCFEGSAGEPIRVLTYNIRYQNPGDGQDLWENRRATVLATILECDLVGLQEVLATQQEEIQQSTPEWQWAAVGRDDGLKQGEMTSIGWRTEKLHSVEQGTFWLSDQPYRIGSRGWDAALPRIATWVRLVRRPTSEPGISESEDLEDLESESGPPSLLLVNTHFDHRGAEARRQSAALLRRWIAENRRDSQVLLVGDLNARLGSPPLDELLDAERTLSTPLLDARLHSSKPDPGPDSTWNGFTQIAPGHRIDHILFQGESISIIAYETLDPRTPFGRFASDHLPIRVEIAF